MRITRAPEFDLITFSFLLNFVWELLQVPLFSSLDFVSHWQGVKTCLQATAGDVSIALVAFWITAAIASERRWINQATILQVFVFLFVGVAVTIAIEYYSTEVAFRWSYAENMPRLPLLGTGLSPILQWIFVPLTVLWFIRRQRIGSG